MFIENFSQMFIENFSQIFTDLFADSRRKNQRKSACFQSAIISERLKDFLADTRRKNQREIFLISHKLLTILFMFSSIFEELKLMSNPNLQFDSFK